MSLEIGLSKNAIRWEAHEEDARAAFAPLIGLKSHNHRILPRLVLPGKATSLSAAEQIAWKHLAAPGLIEGYSYNPFAANAMSRILAFGPFLAVQSSGTGAQALVKGNRESCSTLLKDHAGFVWWGLCGHVMVCSCPSVGAEMAGDVLECSLLLAIARVREKGKSPSSLKAKRRVRR